MRIRSTVWLAFAGSIVLAACGGGTPTAVRSSLQAVNSAAAEASASAAVAAAVEQCEGELRGFLDALHDLDARLDVGLTQSDYNQRVGDINVEYSKIDVEAVTGFGTGCLEQVGFPAEKALNKYIDADSKWSNCIQDEFCSTDSIGLQTFWAEASSQLDTAEAGFDELKPPTPTPSVTPT